MRLPVAAPTAVMGTKAHQKMTNTRRWDAPLNTPRWAMCDVNVDTVKHDRRDYGTVTARSEVNVSGL